MVNANQVVVNGETILDLRSDTVTPETLQKGYTAHDKSGTKITGTLEASSVSVQPSKSVSITSNGTVSVTPDAPYDALKKIDVMVDVASAGVIVSYNTVEPNRYSFDLDGRIAELILTNLVAGSHYICNMHFQGAALDGYNEADANATVEYFITVFSTGSEQNDCIVYSGQTFCAASPITYNRDLVLNLDSFLHLTKNDYDYGMAQYIIEMTDSTIVSWD